MADRLIRVALTIASTIAGVVLVGMMLLTVLDFSLRFTSGSPIAGTFELLSWRMFAGAVNETVRLSAALFLILIGGTMFGYFLTLTHIPTDLAGVVTSLPLAPPLIVAAIFGVYFVLGALMEEIAILVIMTPIVYPIVIGLGYDGVWFGVMSIMMLLTGFLTPPVGLLSFVTSSATGVPLERVYRGVTPFWMTLIVANALVIAFPDIALLLPRLMRG